MLMDGLGDLKVAIGAGPIGLKRCAKS